MWLALHFLCAALTCEEIKLQKQSSPPVSESGGDSAARAAGSGARLGCGDTSLPAAALWGGSATPFLVVFAAGQQPLSKK